MRQHIKSGILWSLNHSAWRIRRCTLLALSAAIAVIARGATYYVAVTGSDAWDGTSWPTAKLTVQAAIDLAVNAGDEVVISNGLYVVPATLTVAKPITIRSQASNPSTVILDGDNIRRVLIANPGAAGLVLEGLTIRNGFVAAGSGQFGAGVRLNVAGTVTNCVFEGNRLEGDACWGGGLAILQGGTVADSHFVDNTVKDRGGAGIWIERGADIYRSVFTGNVAEAAYGGGGIAFWNYTLGSLLTVEDCEFYDNEASTGGGLFIAGTGTALTNQLAMRRCMFEGNRARSTGGGLRVEGRTGGIVEDCEFRDNMATNEAGGLSLAGNANGLLVQRCIVTGNATKLQAASNGGGGMSINAGAIVDRCLIAGNWSHRNGGGVRLGGGTLRNSLVYGNWLDSGGSQGWGGGVHFQSTASVLENCVVTGNRNIGNNNGGGISVYQIGSTIRNTIVVENQSTGSNSNIVFYQSTSAIVTNSCIQQALPVENNSGGNLSVDPGFLQAGSGYGASHTPGDYQIRSDSLCRDVGTPPLAWMTGALDYYGNPRVTGNFVDIGAHEFKGIAGSIFLWR
jgi:hypothetical protein